MGMPDIYIYIYISNEVYGSMSLFLAVCLPSLLVT